MIDKLRGNIKLKDIELVNLINLSEQEKLEILNWRNNPEIRKWMYNTDIIHEREHLNFIDGLASNNQNFYWLGKDNQGDKLGVINLIRVHLKNRNAYLGIYANLGLKKIGKGKYLMDGLIQLAFEVINLHTLKLEVISTNLNAIKFYSKFGFQEEGLLRDFVFSDNQWQDVIVMGAKNPAG